MLSVAIRVCRWADERQMDPLEETFVPGASLAERRRLAAVGGIVGALAEGGTQGWPHALQDWASAAPVPPAPLMADVRGAFEDGGDPLAAIYERAVTPRNRRRLGTFFTPALLVEHMLTRAEALAGRAPDVVVDPGAGVGAFSVAAARRWPDARVIAVDINVVRLGLLAARLGREGVAERTELVLADFLPWLGEAKRDEGAVWFTSGTRRSHGRSRWTQHQGSGVVRRGGPGDERSRDVVDLLRGGDRQESPVAGHGLPASPRGVDVHAQRPGAAPGPVGATVPAA
jgi:hypothetical protein